MQIAKRQKDWELGNVENRTEQTQQISKENK